MYEEYDDITFKTETEKERKSEGESHTPIHFGVVVMLFLWLYVQCALSTPKSRLNSDKIKWYKTLELRRFFFYARARLCFSTILRLWLSIGP